MGYERVYGRMYRGPIVARVTYDRLVAMGQGDSRFVVIPNGRESTSARCSANQHKHRRSRYISKRSYNAKHNHEDAPLHPYDRTTVRKTINLDVVREWYRIEASKTLRRKAHLFITHLSPCTHCPDKVVTCRLCDSHGKEICYLSWC